DEPTPEQVTALQQLMDDGELDGITFEDQFVRARPGDGIASGVIGRSLADGEVDAEGNSGGISGVELAYDAVLAGHPGVEHYEQDASGNPIVGGHRDVEPARQGADVYLTIDESLQYQAEQALIAQVDAMAAQGAMAVVMRPSTGEILAMASVGVGEDGEATTTADNRPVTAVFEPGSTNKMITVAAAIEEGEVAPDTVFEVPDTLPIYDREFTDSHPHATAAWTVADILSTSSNIGTIKIARQLGAERVDEYLRRFGFGQTTGLGFPAEEDGIMKSIDDWSGVDIGSIPIGQGISVTALQMLAAYNAIANDGTYVAPRLVSGLDHGSGQVPTEASEGRRVVSTDTARAMQAMLVRVVAEGTGTPAAVPGYEVAGKTGTSWIAQQGGSDEEDGYLGADGLRHYQASFVGFVAGADLSILVTVNDPRTQVYGSEVAAPVFSELAATALRRYEIPPPALVDPEAHSVPELSATARELEGLDAPGGSLPAAG
ncbi:MAG: penicillin-binding protein 2, partial [Acidimicrobiales bacterium]|nr:penicillin-binding protein 2 [Acidimicrobiales bacterium]